MKVFTMTIYCCQCGGDVSARLSDGGEVYPHRKDLCSIPFWICDTCGNFVGCHHKTKNRTQPLGCIPNQEIRNARKHLHSIIDPIWQSGKMTRSAIYKAISNEIGWNYHTAKTRTIEECKAAYRAAIKLSRQ